MSEKISQKWAAFAFGRRYLRQNFTEYVSTQYTDREYNMPDVAASYGMPLVFITFLCVHNCRTFKG